MAKMVKTPRVVQLLWLEFREVYDQYMDIARQKDKAKAERRTVGQKIKDLAKQLHSAIQN